MINYAVFFGPAIIGALIMDQFLQGEYEIAMKIIYSTIFYLIFAIFYGYLDTGWSYDAKNNVSSFDEKEKVFDKKEITKDEKNKTFKWGSKFYTLKDLKEKEKENEDEDGDENEDKDEDKDEENKNENDIVT